MTALASAFVEARLDTSGFGSDIRRGMSHTSVHSSVDSAGKKIGRGFTASFGSALKLGGVLAAGFAAVKGVQFFKDSIGEAQEAAKVTALTEQVIRSTGNAAHVTSQQVAELSTAISNKTGIDDEAIQKGSNLLLTFKNIRNETGKGNDIFNQATQTVTDMSVALGQDMKAGSIQLGKALNDPIKGITALSRVGVTFSEQQQEQIKGFVEAGDTMKAQKVILAELNSEFGGAAEAAATPADKARVAWGNFQEQVGTMLLPVLGKLATWFTEDAMPVLVRFANYIQSDVVPAVRRWYEYFRENILPVIVDVSKRIYQQMLPALKDLGRFIKTEVLPAARDLVEWFREHWPEISDVIKHVFEFIKQYLGGAFKIIRGIFRVAVALLRGDWDGFWRGMGDIVSGAWQIIKAEVRLGLYAIRQLARLGWELIKVGADRAWGGIVRVVKAAWNGLKKAVGTPIYFVLDTIINDKLIGGFNWLADKLGIGDIPDVPTGGIPHFAKGGFTGAGGKYDPAGIVHAGEFVFDKEKTSKFRALFELIHRMPGYANGGIVWPLPGGTASTYPGHDGVDLNAPNDYGKPFLAAASGTISYVGWGRGYGDAIFERGRYGELVYGHSSRPLVRAGQRVSAGDVLGLVGDTGNATGPHLHFGFPGGTYGQAMAFLSGATMMGPAASGVAGPGSIWDRLSSVAKSAIRDPFTYLSDRIAGPMSTLADNPLMAIIKAVPLKVLDAMVDKISGAAKSVMPSGAVSTGVGMGLDRITPFDSGGLLAPGYTLAYNGTGRYETVRTHRQEAAMRGGGRGPLVWVQEQHVHDGRDAGRKQEQKWREAVAIAGG